MMYSECYLTAICDEQILLPISILFKIKIHEHYLLKSEKFQKYHLWTVDAIAIQTKDRISSARSNEHLHGQCEFNGCSCSRFLPLLYPTNRIRAIFWNISCRSRQISVMEIPFQFFLYL